MDVPHSAVAAAALLIKPSKKSTAVSPYSESLYAIFSEEKQKHSSISNSRSKSRIRLNYEIFLFVESISFEHIAPSTRRQPWENSPNYTHEDDNKIRPLIS